MTHVFLVSLVRTKSKQISLVPNTQTSSNFAGRKPLSQQNMSRSAVSPRVFQSYSPRRPSPLGLPPFTPQGSQDIPCSAYPKTPERYYLQHYSEPTTTSHGMRFPPDVHRRTASSTQRTRALPPAPLSLDSQYHPAAMVVLLPPIEETVQPHSSHEMRAPPSPTPSSTSSLSLYSNESAKKNLDIGEEGEGKGRDKGGGGIGGFCLCFSAFYSILSIPSLFTAYRFLFPDFSALFGTKSKKLNNKILAPQAQAQALAAEPAPAPQMQMVQPRRRPPSLVL